MAEPVWAAARGPAGWAPTLRPEVEALLPAPQWLAEPLSSGVEVRVPVFGWLRMAGPRHGSLTWSPHRQLCHGGCLTCQRNAMTSVSSITLACSIGQRQVTAPISTQRQVWPAGGKDYRATLPLFPQKASHPPGQGRPRGPGQLPFGVFGLSSQPACCGQKWVRPPP